MLSKRRPNVVTWLSVGLLAFSLTFLTRLVASLFPPVLALAVPPWYLPLTGAAWGLAGLAAAGGLFVRLSWAPALTRWGSLAFAAWYWGDRLLLVHTEASRTGWLMALVITILIVGGVWFILGLHPVRSFFSEERP